MKKSLFFLFVLLTVCGVAAAKSPLELKIISYNIRTLARDGENSWQFRKHATKNMIELHKPDAFGLQEAMLPHMQYIDSVCPQYARVGVGRSDGKEGGEFVTIYYNKERFDLLDSGTFWLSETPDQVSRGWDAALPRITTWVKLRDKATKRKFFYFNTHFDHKGTTARVESSKLIVEKIREIAGKKAAVVLTGDFNIESENEALQPLYDNMSAARRCAPITDNKGTYNGWGLMKRYTVIDHIFYGGRKVKCNAFRTLDGDYGAKFISDHFPLEAIFTIR
ncbi:MAG: endonuclease/exonuclease/phosphatase family protein [Bacteroidaceae bacterium]|nr:endonuclease/exonuclease/phosphatase family protein [Bacteroidaceae bacterium]